MIELYTVASANGYKVSIALEEFGLDYTVHALDLQAGEHLTKEYLALNPVGKAPMIIDHDVEGEPQRVYGSVAVLLYLADKCDRLMPKDIKQRAQLYEWLAFIGTDAAPVFASQFYFTVLAAQPYPDVVELFQGACVRMLGVVEQHLQDREYIVGQDYSIADIVTYPLTAVSAQRLPEKLEAYPNIRRWQEFIGQRAAVINGMQIPA